MWISANENEIPGPEAGNQLFLLEYTLTNKGEIARYMSVAHLEYIYEDKEEEYFQVDKETGEKIPKKRLIKVFKQSFWKIDNWYVHKQGYEVVAWKPIEFSGL